MVFTPPSHHFYQTSWWHPLCFQPLQPRRSWSFRDGFFNENISCPASRVPRTGKKHGRFPTHDPWVSCCCCCCCNKKVWGGGVLNFSFKISVFVFSPIRTSCCQFFWFTVFMSFYRLWQKHLGPNPLKVEHLICGSLLEQNTMNNLKDL